MRRSGATLALALAAGLALGSVLILATGSSPARVYGLMLAHTWGDVYGFGQMLFRATMLSFTGLSVALAFRAGLFNVGAEGQLLFGSTATAVVGAALGAATPAPVAILACALAGALGGASLGGLAGWLKARFGAHEVLTTIMLNFIAQAVVLWAGNHGLFLPETVHTRPVVAAARLPSLGLKGSPASFAFFLALGCGALVWWYVERTRRGFELRVLGRSAAAAEAGGVAVSATTVSVLAMAGGLAGLVGTANVLGHKGYFEAGMGMGAGYMGIAVALVGAARPAGVMACALLFATFSEGGLAAMLLYGVPREILVVLEATMILIVAVAAADLQRRRA